MTTSPIQPDSLLNYHGVLMLDNNKFYMLYFVTDTREWAAYPLFGGSSPIYQPIIAQSKDEIMRILSTY